MSSAATRPSRQRKVLHLSLKYKSNRDMRILIDGIAFSVLHEGDKTQPLVVLSHALMANLHLYDSTVIKLHQIGYSTLRYDHVGHGHTQAPDTGAKFHFDDFTRHINVILSRVCPDRQHYAIIGCSMGGVLAIRYALMYPGQVKKIIACGVPGMTSLEASKPKWRSRIKQFQDEGIESLAKVTVERWMPEPCPQEIRNKALQQTLSSSLAGYKACADGIMNYDYIKELSHIGSSGEEVLIIRGSNDEAVGPPEVMLDIAKRIPGSRYEVMQDVGHLPPMHDSTTFEKLMTDFLTHDCKTGRSRL